MQEWGDIQGCQLSTFDWNYEWGQIRFALLLTLILCVLFLKKCQVFTWIAGAVVLFVDLGVRAGRWGQPKVLVYPPI